MLRKALYVAFLLTCSLSAFAQKAPSTALFQGPYTTGKVPANCGFVNGTPIFCASNGGGGSTKVVYASALSGAHPGVVVVPGSSAVGTADSAAALNTALASGNVDLEVDSGFALSTSLVVGSNTTIHCTSPQYGFIMQPSANASVVVNAHQNSPTTTSGTGGYLPSNISDSNIVVRGCTLNANSTQAVTGSNSSGTAHGATPGGKFVYGIFFLGVNGVDIDSNESYDTGTWNYFISNATQVNVRNNYIHQPTPLVTLKFTDCIHNIGPVSFEWIQSNRLNCGDDAIALNADDGNRTGSGDPNASYVQTAVKWGPIQHVYATNNQLDSSYFGPRLLSATELIDDVTIDNTTGNLCGNVFTMTAGYPGLGPGNLGTINIKNFAAPTSGTCSYGTNQNFYITENYKMISIDGIHETIAINWPLINHNVATSGVLSLHNIDLVSTGVTSYNPVTFTGGTSPQVIAGGINWVDNTANTGSFFSGSLVPTFLTCSNYSGPSRLLASGFVPTNKNGDCFTNAYLAVPAAIHFWPMNEGTGSTFVDHVGTTNLTASNVTWATSTGLGASAVAQFNGTSSHAAASAVDSSLNFNGTQPMTIAYWENSPSSTSTVVGNLQTGGSYQGWETGPNQAFLVVGAVTTNQMSAEASAASLSTAHLIVVTYTGSLNLAGVKIYYDGTSQSLTDAAGTLTSGSTSTVPLQVGARLNSTNWYQGAIAYMRVWNQVLTQAQVTALYQAGPQ